jgi:prephenate dehydratase
MRSARELSGYAVLPFENTMTGSISLNYDLLLHEGLTIVRDISLPIRHCLLAHKGAALTDIRRVHSHPQALEQCRHFLREHLRACPEYDTAGAVRIVKGRDNKEEVAIASALCADIYGLAVLASDIQGNNSNITQFLILAKPQHVPRNLAHEKTSIAFKTKHYPGALINCLQRLSKNDINLTKLESRHIIGNPWEYVFYADFMGELVSRT